MEKVRAGLNGLNIYLSAVAMDEILGTSKNVTGRGLLTIHTNKICDLFVVAGVVPPVTYTLRIENGVVRVSGMSRPLHLLKIWMIISQRMDMTRDTTDSTV